MTEYAYLGTNEDLAEKYASVLHDLVCSDDMIEDRRIAENLRFISSQIVQRFMEDNGYIRNGAMLWVNAGNIENNGECAARGRRAESEVDNDNQSKNGTESKSTDTESK